ncbi:MAG: hypothetical protein OHK0017_07150 [Patescibacteria group bacterium]
MTDPQSHDLTFSEKEFLKAVSLRDLGQFEKALEKLNQIQPEYFHVAEFHFQMAGCYFGLHKFLETEIEAKKGLAIEPNSHTLLQLLYLGLKNQKKFKEAREVANKLLTLKPDWATSHFNIADLYYLTKKGKKETAFAHLKEANRLDPINTDVLDYLAIFYLEQKKYNLSEEYFLEALKLAPTDSRIIHNYILLLYKTRRKDEAIKQLMELLKIDPNSKFVLDSGDRILSMEFKGLFILRLLMAALYFILLFPFSVLNYLKIIQSNIPGMLFLFFVILTSGVAALMGPQQFKTLALVVFLSYVGLLVLILNVSRYTKHFSIETMLQKYKAKIISNS